MGPICQSRQMNEQRHLYKKSLVSHSLRLGVMPHPAASRSAGLLCTIWWRASRIATPSAGAEYLATGGKDRADERPPHAEQTGLRGKARRLWRARKARGSRTSHRP